MVTIAIDAMGGDNGLSVTMPAVKSFLGRNEADKLILVGREAEIRSEMEKLAIASERISVRHAEQVVGMDEVPQDALRHKRDSSMRVACDLIKSGEADGALSSGNTGALMATARYALKTMAGMRRPAIARYLPTKIPGKNVLCLDLGANVDVKAEQLCEFAILGSHWAQMVSRDPSRRPAVGLLNVGVEEIKGGGEVKKAYAALSKKELDVDFAGNAEADAIFSGEFDVVVCDGFAGNVMLKTIEGTVKFLGSEVKQAFTRNIFAKICAAIALPALAPIRKKYDPRAYNGAILLGLNGLVLKSHGGTDAKGFCAAMLESARLAAEFDMQAMQSAVEGDARRLPALLEPREWEGA